MAFVHWNYARRSYCILFIELYCTRCWEYCASQANLIRLCQETVVACLAATALGAIWVSAASDFGPEGVLERLEQVRPKVLFSIDSQMFVVSTT